MPDHLGDQLAPIVALAAGFGMTRRLRMGALVACNDFRLPFVYEKKLANAGCDVIMDEAARVMKALFWDGKVESFPARFTEAVALLVDRLVGT
jgi:hypothetical protein